MRATHLLYALSIGIAISLQLGAACESNSTYYGDRGGGYVDPGPPPPPPYGGGYGGGYPPPPVVVYPPGDGFPDYDRPNRIPRWSDLVREGQGKLRWTCDLDGEIYVYDVSKDYIAYTGRISRGQELIVHPDEDRVYIEGRVVSNQNLRRDARYQVYFARIRQPARPPQRPPVVVDPIPAGSNRMARGDEYIEIASAPRNGTAFLYDELDRKILFTATLRRGNNIQIFRREGYISVNGRRVKTMNFARGHTLSIYFRAD